MIEKLVRECMLPEISLESGEVSKKQRRVNLPEPPRTLAKVKVKSMRLRRLGLATGLTKETPAKISLEQARRKEEK